METNDRRFNKIEEYFIPEGNANRPGNLRKPEDIKGVVWHYTGVEGQTPKNTIDTWIAWGNKDDPQYASSQYVIGTDGSIYAAMPELEKAIHANGNSSYPLKDSAKSKYGWPNSTTIGIEIEPTHITYDDKGNPLSQSFSMESINSAIKLTAEVMLRYGLNPEEDLERHYDLTNKPCPLYYVNNEGAWHYIKYEVEQEMERLGGIW